VPTLISLDDDAALDPARVGVKAANLAQAKRHGLRVLPGAVIRIEAGREAMDLGIETLRAAGPGKARLAVDRASIAQDLADVLPVAAAALGESLILRSSTSLDEDDRFSGAFASIGGVRPNEVASAIRGCWSSLFSASTLGRLEASGVAPESVGVAVLMQRMLDPELGGTAEVRADGSVAVWAVAGQPGPLLAGAAAGVWGQLRAGLDVPDALRAIGLSRKIAAVLVASAVGADLVGHRRIEWAAERGQTWLLQLDHGSPVPERSLVPAVDASNGAIRLVGTPASPGSATGQVRVLTAADLDHPPDVAGRILVIDQPLPSFAPLVWSAAGLACAGGSPAAHLCGVARSLHVPVVVSVDLTGIDIEWASPRLRLSIDGSIGELLVFDSD
jgi:pyruvate,water dikinase